MTKKKVSEENFQSNLSPHANKGESAGHDLAHKLNGKVKKGSRAGSDINLPTQFITSFNNHTLQVKHVNENWNQQNWLRRHVHSAIKESRLSSIIVDCKWFVKNTKYDTQSCQNRFFTTILPRLSEQSFLEKNACIYLPMHPWFYTQLCLQQKTLEEWYAVDFVKATALDEAHGAWISDEGNKETNLTHFYNLHEHHEFAAAKKVDKFLGKIETCMEHGKVEKGKVEKAMRSFADNFFQLEDQKFTTLKRIRLRQHHGTLANNNYITPPAQEKEDLELKWDKKGTIWMLGLPFEQSKGNNNAWLQHVHTIQMQGSTNGVDSDEIENGDKDKRDKGLDEVLRKL